MDDKLLQFVKWIENGQKNTNETNVPSNDMTVQTLLNSVQELYHGRLTLVEYKAFEKILPKFKSFFITKTNGGYEILNVGKFLKIFPRMNVLFLSVCEDEYDGPLFNFETLTKTIQLTVQAMNNNKYNLEQVFVCYNKKSKNVSKIFIDLEKNPTKFSDENKSLCIQFDVNRCWFFIYRKDKEPDDLFGYVGCLWGSTANINTLNGIESKDLWTYNLVDYHNFAMILYNLKKKCVNNSVMSYWVGNYAKKVINIPYEGQNKDDEKVKKIIKAYKELAQQIIFVEVIMSETPKVIQTVRSKSVNEHPKTHFKGHRKLL